MFSKSYFGIFLLLLIGVASSAAVNKRDNVTYCGRDKLDVFFAQKLYQAGCRGTQDSACGFEVYSASFGCLCDCDRGLTCGTQRRCEKTFENTWNRLNEDENENSTTTVPFGSSTKSTDVEEMSTVTKAVKTTTEWMKSTVEKNIKSCEMAKLNRYEKLRLSHEDCSGKLGSSCGFAVKSGYFSLSKCMCDCDEGLECGSGKRCERRTLRITTPPTTPKIKPTTKIPLKDNPNFSKICKFIREYNVFASCQKSADWSKRCMKTCSELGAQHKRG